MTAVWRGWVASLAVGTLVLAGACGDDSSGGDPSEDDPTGEDGATADDVTFPGEEWTVSDPEDLGLDPEVLDDLAAEAEDNGSHCLLVARDGQIAAEWYWGDAEPTTPHEAWSVTKSYTSTLVGIAQDEGHLDIDDRVAEHVPELEGTDSEDVTIRNLLSNDSGRQWSVAEYGPITASRDVDAYALDLGQETPPGTAWEYNDGAIQLLGMVLRSATGEEPADLAEEWIFEPIGASRSELSRDPSGHTYMYFGLQSTCRDMARFGHLFLQGGVWDGEQVLPDGWVEEATGQPSQDLSAGYGFLWWLNRPGNVEGAGAGEGRPGTARTGPAGPTGTARAVPSPRRPPTCTGPRGWGAR